MQKLSKKINAITEILDTIPSSRKIITNYELLLNGNNSIFQNQKHIIPPIANDSNLPNLNLESTLYEMEEKTFYAANQLKIHFDKLSKQNQIFQYFWNNESNYNFKIPLIKKRIPYFDRQKYLNKIIDDQFPTLFENLNYYNSHFQLEFKNPTVKDFSRINTGLITAGASLLCGLMSTANGINMQFYITLPLYLGILPMASLKVQQKSENELLEQYFEKKVKICIHKIKYVNDTISEYSEK